MITIGGVHLQNAQVVVNGTRAAVLAATSERVEFAIPFVSSPMFVVKIQRAGMESDPITVRSVPVHPAVSGVRRVADRYLEIYATGLGALNGQALAAPVTAAVSSVPARVLYAGAAPGQAYLYQINLELPAADIASGTVDLRVAERAVQVPF